MKLPHFFERMIGFSLPVGRRVAIVSYEGVHFLDLSAPEQVRADARYPEGRGVFDAHTGKLSIEGCEYPVLGLHGGTPLQISARGETLHLDLSAELLEIKDPTGHLALRFRFKDFSGDWGYATFSQDSEFVLLGVPYELYLFRRTIQ